MPGLYPVPSYGIGRPFHVTLDGFEPPTSCQAGALSRVSYRVRRVLGSDGIGWHQAEQSTDPSPGDDTWCSSARGEQDLNLRPLTGPVVRLTS